MSLGAGTQADRVVAAGASLCRGRVFKHFVGGGTHGTQKCSIPFFFPLLKEKEKKKIRESASQCVPASRPSSLNAPWRWAAEHVRGVAVGANAQVRQWRGPADQRKATTNRVVVIASVSGVLPAVMQAADLCAGQARASGTRSTGRGAAAGAFGGQVGNAGGRGAGCGMLVAGSHCSLVPRTDPAFGNIDLDQREPVARNLEAIIVEVER